MNNFPHSSVTCFDKDQNIVNTFLNNYSGASIISTTLSNELQSIPSDVLKTCIMNYVSSNKTWFEDLIINNSHLYLKMFNVPYYSASSDTFNNKAYQEKYWQ